jgi:hypothetical protein
MKRKLVSVILGNLGNRLQGMVIQTDPDVAVALDAVEGIDPVGFGNRSIGVELGHIDAGAAGVVLPTVVGTTHTAIFDEALGELGRTVAAAIAQSGRLAAARRATAPGDVSSRVKDWGPLSR